MDISLVHLLTILAIGSWAEEMDDAPVHAASKIVDEKRKRNAGASSRFRQRRKDGECSLEWRRQGALLEPSSVGKAQDPRRGQCNNLTDASEAKPGSGVNNTERAKPEVSYTSSGPGSEALPDHDKGYLSRREHESSAQVPTNEAKHSWVESHQVSSPVRARMGSRCKEALPPQGQQIAEILRHKPKMTESVPKRFEVRDGLVRKVSPAVLKLETLKPVDSKTTSPYLASLRNAQFSNTSKAFRYPTGVIPSNFDLTKAGSAGTIRYDLRFLMQFRPIVSETPAKATIDQLICHTTTIAILTNQSQSHRRHSPHSSIYGASDMASAPPRSS